MGEKKIIFFFVCGIGIFGVLVNLYVVYVWTILCSFCS